MQSFESGLRMGIDVNSRSNWLVSRLPTTWGSHGGGNSALAILSQSISLKNGCRSNCSQDQRCDGSRRLASEVVHAASGVP